MCHATRKNSSPVKVYCLPDERATLTGQARAAGLSLSSYLLTVGLGYRIEGILDHECVEELARINGDLGRLGGLLKLWLTNDERTREFGEATIRAVLGKIEETQGMMQDVMRSIVLPRTRR